MFEATGTPPQGAPSLSRQQRVVRTTSVVCFCHDTVLMVHQHNSRGDMWTLPGGKVDPGENFEEAAIRECQEETAIALTQPLVDGLICVSLVEAQCPEIHLIRTIFVAHIEGAAPRPIVGDVGGEVTDAEFKPRAEAVELLASMPVPAQREPFVAAVNGANMSYYTFSTDQPGVGLVAATRHTGCPDKAGQLTN